MMAKPPRASRSNGSRVRVTGSPAVVPEGDIPALAIGPARHPQHPHTASRAGQTDNSPNDPPRADPPHTPALICCAARAGPGALAAAQRPPLIQHSQIRQGEARNSCPQLEPRRDRRREAVDQRPKGLPRPRLSVTPRESAPLAR
jgi:hypothetical protein